MSPSPTRHRILARALLVLLAASPLPAAAAENMRFSGTLITPGCAVSDKGASINVVFKTNLGIEKIDGEQYRQRIPYQIECPGSLPWRMKMTLVATETDFDSAAVETSIDGLGIHLQLGDEAFTLNVPKPIQMTDRNNPPELVAVPVRRSGTRLPETEFEATALLVAELY